MALTQIQLLNELIPNTGLSDDVIQFYLDRAKEIICEIRFTDYVEVQYVHIQTQIALELISKRGAEGETGHSENGVGRTYETADVSKSLLNQIIPYLHSVDSIRRTLV